MSNQEDEDEYVFEFDESLDESYNSCVEFIESFKKGFIQGDSPYIMGPNHKPFKIT